MKINFYTEFECSLCGHVLRFCSDLYIDKIKGAYCIGDLAAHYVEDQRMKKLLTEMLREENKDGYPHKYHPVWEMEIKE